jgi:hypothetical protein
MGVGSGFDVEKDKNFDTTVYLSKAEEKQGKSSSQTEIGVIVNRGGRWIRQVPDSLPSLPIETVYIDSDGYVDVDRHEQIEQERHQRARTWMQRIEDEEIKKACMTCLSYLWGRWKRVFQAPDIKE